MKILKIISIYLGIFGFCLIYGNFPKFAFFVDILFLVAVVIILGFAVKNYIQEIYDSSIK